MPGLLVVAWPWPVAGLLAALAALVATWMLHVTLLARSDGDEGTRFAAVARREEASRSFAAAVRALAGAAFVVLVVQLSLADDSADRFVAWGLVLGAGLALLAAAIALRAEHAAAPRVLEAARAGEPAAREIERLGGSVTALAAGGLGLLGLCLLWLVARDPMALLGAALGASAVALLLGQCGRGFESAAEGATRLESLVAATAASVAIGDQFVRSADLEYLEKVVSALPALPALIVLPLA